ncbi:hypothetical protein JB92DRAFT_3103513 [Gautieria morchelliformis]|nr:hypothetical protein JB92DRAFT_3103513 [Gautieria morchelliformis]
MASRSVVGAEPTEAGADDAFRSSTRGTFHPSVNPKTLADELLTSRCEIMFPLIMEHVDASYTQSPVNKLLIDHLAAVALSIALSEGFEEQYTSVSFVSGDIADLGSDASKLFEMISADTSDNEDGLSCLTRRSQLPTSEYPNYRGLMDWGMWYVLNTF